MTTDPLLACRPMNAPRAARFALAVTFLVAGWACSNNTPKDQFYGTDVGANWIPPDATARDAPGDASAGETGSSETGLSVDGAEAQVTDASTDGLDAGTSGDAPAGDT